MDYPTHPSLFGSYEPSGESVCVENVKGGGDVDDG